MFNQSTPNKAEKKQYNIPHPLRLQSDLAFLFANSVANNGDSENTPIPTCFFSMGHFIITWKYRKYFKTQMAYIIISTIDVRFTQAYSPK